MLRKIKPSKPPQRWGLTLLVSALVFVIIVISVTVASVLVYILLLTGEISSIDGRPDPKFMLIFTASLSLAIGLGVTLFVSRMSVKPLHHLIAQINRMASGDFKARLHFGKFIQMQPAVVELTESFNKMAKELENTEMLRSDFINNFSHEFKTPIVSIAGFAKVLKRGHLTDERKKEYLDIIEEEALRLAEMATNVLHLTKIENQTILTDCTLFNLSEQVRNSLVLLEHKWSKKNLEFDLDFNEYQIEANEELLKQLWINLLDNAIKFSPTYGTIDVRIVEKGDVLCVTIGNQGEMIPKKQQAYIFNKFYQADESHSSEGNGIGLALVKQIVLLHEGHMQVTSAPQKTCFEVTLPFTRKQRNERKEKC
jgi:signal transduction histidine kinase